MREMHFGVVLIRIAVEEGLDGPVKLDDKSVVGQVKDGVVHGQHLLEEWDLHHSAR